MKRRPELYVPEAPPHGEPEALEDTIARVRFAATLARHVSTTIAPVTGHKLVIATPFIEERFAFTECALRLGWAVGTPAPGAHPRSEVTANVVLVVVRPDSPLPGLCHDFRRAGYARDLVYLASSGDHEECQHAEEAGAKLAVPGLPQPALVRALVSWLRAAQERYPRRLRHGDFELDASLDCVKFRGMPLDLPLRLFEAMRLLIEHQGVPLPLADLASRAGYASNDGSGRRKLIQRLRARVGDDTKSIIVSAGQGKYFLAPLRA